MQINERSHRAGKENYYKLAYPKKKILLTDSGRIGMMQLKTLKLRQLGKAPCFPTFTISRLGEIFRHFPSQYYSDFTGKQSLDRDSVHIVLENCGWLKPLGEEGLFVNWAGDEISLEHEVISQHWREQNHWHKYTVEQYDALAFLVRHLCDKHSIPMEFVGHSMIEEGVERFEGVCARANMDMRYHDVNPSFDYKRLISLCETTTA